jgi:TetR/AcrR family transcriptional repressor of nem operon
MARTKEFDADEVLNKAIALFWDKGYNGCSMQDIVDGLGLSRSSIYETFQDKRQLFLEALKKYQREGMEELAKNLDSAADIRQALVNIFESSLPEDLNEPLKKGCFMVNTATELTAHDSEIAAIVEANRVGVEDILCKAIKKGQRNGQISSTLDARAMARFFFATLSGIRVTASSGADRRTLKDIIKVTLSVL